MLCTLGRRKLDGIAFGLGSCLLSRAWAWRAKCKNVSLRRRSSSRDICILRTCEIATMRHANVIASKTSAQNNSMWELFVIHESLQKSRYRYRMKRPLATNTNSCVVMRNTGVRCERHCGFFLPTFHIAAGALRTHGFIFEPDVFVIRRSASIT